ncbi:E7 [Gammapapillomavirus 18]|uniref:Protein E7 n=1 Tax=Gammapapillomavirus 18 TaxID=1513263 RepID=A0A2D2ALY4_9PAPI|nr:E7 [Gammapapillomavirus 18]
MRGERSTIHDIELNLEALVLPQNLISNESLSPDVEYEEEEQSPYSVDTCCHSCGTGVRLCVLSTRLAIRTLQQLLALELSLFCPSCARNQFRHGRR